MDAAKKIILFLKFYLLYFLKDFFAYELIYTHNVFILGINDCANTIMSF